MRHIAFRWVMAVFIVIGSGLGVWQGGQMSPPHAFAAGTLAIDQLVTTHQTSAGTGISSPTFTTTQTGELLIAFVTSDGPYPGVQTFSSMTGGGLAWRLRKRTNTQAGTAEIWQAVAQNVLTNATVTATRASGGFLGSITVATFTGASTTVDGATGGANASTGAPSASLVTTKPGSWVWAVGDDWDQALARTVGANQTKVDEFLASSGDTFWVQRATALTSLSGATVTINDTAPTSDRWNMSLIEIPSAAVDTTPPTAPTNLVGTATGPTTVSLNWGAATDNTAVTGYSVLRGGTQIGTSTTLAYTDTSVLATTTYTYTVQAYDAAGNFGPTSNVVTVTTPAPAPDTTPPTVSITGPITGATVSGSVSVTANASDNIGVAGVQFTLDGGSLGAEVTTSPYAVQWDTATASNGSHTLVAVARDAAGNTTTAKSVTVTVSNSAGNQATVGQWGPVVTWPEVSIHAALTPSGKILTFQGDFTQGGQQYLLNPTTGTYIQVPNAAADLFCAGQAVTADGRILVIGGTATSGGLGIKAITAFDSTTETWQNLAPMHYPRWYATGTTLGDGRVFVTSGDNQNSTDVVPIPEMYDVLHNTWSDLPGASNAMPIYPFIYQLPDGRILHAGGSEVPTATEVLNLATQTWTTIDARIIDGASIANYAPGKFIKAGSATDSGKTGPSTNTAFTLDMNQPNPTWQPTTSMQYPRSFVNLTNLPDGTVLATGGGTEKSGYNDANAVLPAEVWNPATGTWKTVAALTAPRLYHSVAVLLPDGRVFVSGSGGDPGVGDQKNYQIYSPSYLFKGPRPTITSAPSTVRYNSSQFIGTPDAAGITSVTLIRTGSVTHSFDQNARSMSLNFTQTAGGLNVQMPVDGNTAPPGYYLLSIVNSQGVPSVSSYVRFAAPYEDSIAPTAPASLTANGAIGSASLTWTAATDNVGVTAYDVYRSTTPGFTATSSNKIGQVVGNTLAYTDTAVTAGTYYYQVRAEDAAGNIGPSSNEASANVLSDTTPPSAPGSLVASASGTQTVNLSWGAATDNVAVSRYNVLRNGAQIGTTPGLTYADNTVSASTTYTYTVTAQDAAGNVGPPSNAVIINVNPAPAVTLIQNATRTSGGASSIAATFSKAVTAGNLIVVGVSGWPGGGTLNVTDSLGNTYAQAGGTSVTAGGSFSALFYAKNSKAGTDVITFGNGVSGTQLSMVASEFSGLDTTSPLDGSASAAGSNNAPSSGSMTPTMSGDLLIGSGTHDTTVTTSPGANMSMVSIATENATTLQPLAMDYQILGTASAASSSFKLSSSSNWAQNGVLFKPAGGSPVQTYSLSGAISPSSSGSGSTVSLSGPSTATVTADASGNFVFTGLANGSYTVTPTKSGFSFNPASQPVTINNGNATGTSFSITPFSTGVQLVQKNFNGNEAATGNMSIALPANVKAGNFLIVSASAARPASTLTISDSVGDTFLPAYGPVHDAAQDVNLYVWYVQAAKGGPTTFTITPPASAALEIHVSEWSGMPANAVVDQTSSSTGNGTVVSSGSKTTTANGELVFGYSWVFNTASAGSGFTGLSLINGDLDEYTVQPNAGSIAATFAQSSPGTWLAIMVGFK